MNYGFLSILPSVLAIVLALTTKNVFLALLASLLLGNLFLADYSLIGMLVGLLVFPICRSFDKISQYSLYVYLYVIASAASQMYLCDLRGKELLVYYSIGNVLNTLFIACFNILCSTHLKLFVLPHKL